MPNYHQWNLVIKYAYSIRGDIYFSDKIYMIATLDRFLYVHIWDTQSNLVDTTGINLRIKNVSQ